MKRKFKIVLLLTLVISPTTFINDESVKALTIQEKVSAGKEHSLALKKNGAVWAWGENSDGQLGINNTTDQNIPVQVVGENGIGFLENIIDISAGTDHSIALKDDGTVWIWGANDDGQLGNGTTVDKITPIKVPNLTNVVEISAGWSYTHIVKSDGSVWAWGRGTSGELGIGATIQSLIPIQVVGVGGTGYLGNIVDISTGEQHVLALKNDGTVYSWGMGASGRLGTDATVNSNTPLKVVNETNTGDLLNIQKISAGYNHSMALAQDGSLYVWGNNDIGQLGIGSYNTKNKPYKMISLTNVKEISAGIGFSMAVKVDGTLWSWGGNTEGELGIGNYTDKNNPNQVLNEDGTSFISNVTSISAANLHSLATTTNGSVFSWGDASSGKLGNGINTGLFNKPVKINDFNINDGAIDAGLTIDSGQFKMTDITNTMAFEDYTLGKEEVSLTLKSPFSFSVEDFTGTWSGWKANLKVAGFKNNTQDLIESTLTSNCTNALVYDTDELGVKTGINGPISNEFTCSAGNIPFDTTFPLITAAASVNTAGKHIFEFPKEFLSLSFSNKSKFGNYTGEVMLTLTTGP